MDGSKTHSESIEMGFDHPGPTYMTARKSRRKLKIAVIFMPVSEIRPPVSLTGLAVSGDVVMDEIARRLARSHDVIAYCSRGEHQQKVEQLDGVRISAHVNIARSLVLISSPKNHGPN